MQTMDDLFYTLLQDVYFSEKELLKVLPKLAQKSANETLRVAFRDHEDETAEQMERLERVFEVIGKEPRAKASGAMAAIIDEAQHFIDEIGDAAVRDAGLLAAAQAAEHHEIARYATLLAWAEHLGEDEIVELLSETLEEETHASELLASIAEGGINATASERADAAAV
jgi:ferritin-like metal-binding protein YciE